MSINAVVRPGQPGLMTVSYGKQLHISPKFTFSESLGPSGGLQGGDLNAQYVISAAVTKHRLITLCSSVGLQNIQAEMFTEEEMC